MNFNCSEKMLQKVSMISQNIRKRKQINLLTIGGFGRYGNQLIRYLFLLHLKYIHQADIECNPWIGEKIYTIKPGNAKIEPQEKTYALSSEIDELRSLQFYPAYQFRYGNTPSVKIMEQARYFEKKILPMDEFILNSEAEFNPIEITGYFTRHTSIFRENKAKIINEFRYQRSIYNFLEPIETYLKQQGKTIVTIHIRDGDVIGAQLILGELFFAVPLGWYINFLKANWNKWEDPILYICGGESFDLSNLFAEFKYINFNILNKKKINTTQSLTSA
jgi:hypothetical protein